MIFGQLFKLDLVDDVPFISVYTLSRTPREQAMKEAAKAFSGIMPPRQLIFMHSDGELELWDYGFCSRIVQFEKDRI